MLSWWDINDRCNFQSMLYEFADNKQHYNVMQYTGITDINDKEIYEGDIVKHSGNMTGRVYYDKAETSFILEPVDNVSSYETLGLQSELEVIGNEFENTELIVRSV